jgi:hypothetical protein
VITVIRVTKIGDQSNNPKSKEYVAETISDLELIRTGDAMFGDVVLCLEDSSVYIGSTEKQKSA